VTGAGLPEGCLDRVIEVLRSEPSVEGAVLFGSRAKGSFREGSDIDIAILGTGVTPAVRLSLLTRYDALYLPWKLDLVIYDSIAEPALKAHIDRVGVRLWGEAE
jgi:predicted nucleotidyltransferase